MRHDIMSKKRFARLSPYLRGYAVYMAGCRSDQPNIPNESNPYRPGTHPFRRWEQGQHDAMLATIDGEE